MSFLSFLKFISPFGGDIQVCG